MISEDIAIKNIILYQVLKITISINHVTLREITAFLHSLSLLTDAECKWQIDNLFHWIASRTQNKECCEEGLFGGIFNYF